LIGNCSRVAAFTVLLGKVFLWGLLVEKVKAVNMISSDEGDKLYKICKY